MEAMKTPDQTSSTPTRKAPSGWGKLWAAFGLGVLAFLVVIPASILGALAQVAWSVDYNVVYTIVETCAAIVAFLFFVALCGWKMGRPSVKGMGEAWKAAAWLFVVDGMLLALAIVEVIVGVEPFELSERWPMNTLVLAVLCLGVGIFEESTMRGLCLNGLLARMGRTRAGVYGAVIISSFLFGMLHFDPTINFSDPLEVAQNVMKVVQTGICGFLLAAIFIKTRNIWTAIIIHAANDFMLMFLSFGLMNEEIETEYVLSGNEGVEVLVVYCIICVLYSPLIIISKRLIDQASPWRGLFYKYDTAEANAGAMPPGARVGAAPLAPGIPVATPVDRPAAPQETEVIRGKHASRNQNLQPGMQQTLVSIDEATAKAMRGKHAAPLRQDPSKGTPHGQGL